MLFRSNVRLSWDLRVMEMTDFDVILGMDWLTTHRATLDCYKKTVVAYTPEGLRFCHKGSIREMWYPSARKTRRWDELVGRIAALTLNEIDGSSLELPCVVDEFADVVPEELPGLLPRREIDFTIDLQPGTSPISMAPHRMAPAELRELKTQLQELLDSGFIQLSTSPW